jgi:hypothetical protein
VGGRHSGICASSVVELIRLEGTLVGISYPSKRENSLSIDRYMIDAGQSGPLFLYMKEHMALPLPVLIKTLPYHTP